MISNTLSRTQITASGETTFNYTFYVLASGDLEVIGTASGVDTTYVEGVDYTVTGVGNPAGGTVVFGVAPAGGTVITLRRRMLFRQLVDLVTQGGLDANVIEEMADRLTMYVQQLDELLDRALVIPASDAITLDGLPSAADRASRYLAFDGAGQPVVAAGGPGSGTVPVSPFMETVLDDTSAGDALTTLGVSAYAQTLLDDADEAAARATLGAVGNLKSVQVFTSPGTWNKPAGLVAAVVHVVGGGGGGGGAQATAAGNASVGAGGGGGGYSRKRILAASLGASETVTVGAGGAAITGNNTGNSGGTSSFGSHCSATGGAGGGNASSGNGFTGSGGGNGGIGSGGDINTAGGAGSKGIRHGTATLPNTLAYPGEGGTSFMGGGGRSAPTTTTAAGTDGRAYGGGGSGAANGESQSGQTSGAGAAGIVIVEEYF